MNQAVKEMLAKYSIQSSAEAENALKEIIQEIALLGLHRANFFEKAAFYGGTSLRILYGLPRYSEDLDFTLFKQDANFKLTPYFSAVEKELEAYGFQVNIEAVDKNNETEIESAFIKANTKLHILKVESLSAFASKLQTNAKLQIKFEVDTEPVTNFNYETRYLLAPTSFPIISLKKPDLFAGKLHALLFRKWKARVKGRDFYDFVWYLKNNTPVRLDYFREKAVQSGHLNSERLKNLDDLKKILIKRFESVDFESAKKDVLPFIKNAEEVALWNKDFFIQITEKLQLD
ncbi:MAG: nucleotidyl transferase AbiEii/AbiGii toxin family protein [Pseudobdellovibrio sp.]